jgi:peptidoglycan/LPS O-acetylase OafA/YrhL
MSTLKLEIAAPVTGRLPVVDELKGVAIALVVLYHAGGVLVWNNYLHGDLGVDIFVILSGVGLALSSRHESTPAFLRRRLLRIFPAYWITLTIFLVCNIHFLQQTYTPFDIIIHYLGIHGWFGDYYGMGINDSFWFITLILSLYVMYCLFQPLLMKVDRLLLAGAAISVALAFAFFFTSQAGIFGHVALRIPGFFIGLLIGQLLKSGRLDLPLTTSLVLAIFLITYVPYTQGIVFHTSVAALGVMAGYIWLWKPFAPAGIEAPTARCCKFLGDHSLEIFLLHQPLIRDYNIYLQGRWFNIATPTTQTLTIGIFIGLVVTVFVSVELRALLLRIPLLNRSSA